MMVGTPLAYWRTHDPLWLVVWLIVDKAQLPRKREPFPSSGKVWGGWCFRGLARHLPIWLLPHQSLAWVPLPRPPCYGCAEAQWFAIYEPVQSKVVV